MLLGTNAKPESRAVGWPSSLLRIAVFYSIFLVAVFAYVWLRVQPAVQFHVHGPFMVSAWPQAAPFLTRPGTLADYLGSLAAQLDYLNWAGAMLFTLFLGAGCCLSGVLLRRITAKTPELLLIMPGLVLLLAREQPGFPVWPAVLGWLLGLGGAVAWGAWPPRTDCAWKCKCLRAASCAVAAIIVLLAGGFWAAGGFIVLVFLDEGYRRKDWMSAVFCLIAAVGSAAALACIIDTPLANLVNPWKTGTELLYGAGISACVPLLALVLRFLPFPKTAGTNPAPHGQRKAEAAGELRKKQVRTFVLKRAGQVALGSAACASVWLAFDQHAHSLAQIDYCSNRGADEQVLARARRATLLDTPAQIRVHLALYHTGRLAEDLFAFPLSLGAEPLPGVTAGLNTCRPQARTLLELGLVSDAEHLAHEALEMEGERPDLLRDLALVNVLKDRPRAAVIFLNVLARMPSQSGVAGAALKELADDPAMSKDTFLNGIRSLMVTNDLPHEALPAEALLRQSLLFNPRNRMAFEYLMSHYLLTLELKKAMERLTQLGNFGYKGIPRHYQEAVVLFQSMENVQVQLDCGTIQPETVAKFARFNEAMKQRLYAAPGGREKMLAQFGDTYWYYYFLTRNYLERTQRSPDKAAGMQ